MWKAHMLATALGVLISQNAMAYTVSFDSAWQEQKFSLFSSNQYSFSGSRLGVASDGTASLVWKPLPREAWQGRSASWTWRVETSVPPTDLTLKGGDDRNLSLYFVFLPEDVAARSKDSNIRALLNNKDARVITYVWGGNHARNQMLVSPYLGPRGRTVAVRPSGTGEERTEIDLARDFH